MNKYLADEDEMDPHWVLWTVTGIGLMFLYLSAVLF